jgi:energy-coupling factor transporter ATP-binding protein EcfA2
MPFRFERITLNSWRQFHKIDIEFHAKLTVITGANGSGKSSLLGILTQHFGWQRLFLGTPLKRRHNGTLRFLTGLRQKRQPNLHEYPVGSVEYSPAASALLQTSAEALQFAISIHNQQHVLGTYISSHRSPPVFQQIGAIQVGAQSPDQAYSQFQNESIQRSAGNFHGPTPIFRMKEALVSMATFGPKTDYSFGDSSALEIIRGFSEVLRKTMPPSLGFQSLSLRQTDVVLETDSGNFLLDAASGGIMAIVDITWQIYIYSMTSIAKTGDGFAVIMDEPENHLHPSMQRALLSNLIDAFPTAQFIVATHSPFMVSSVQDSSVYVLRHQELTHSDADIEVDDGGSVKRFVVSERLDVVNRAGSAGDILRDVLGVPVTTPLWVENELEQLVNKYRDLELSVDNLRELKSHMAKLGFGELYPQAIAKLVQE